MAGVGGRVGGMSSEEYRRTNKALAGTALPGGGWMVSLVFGDGEVLTRPVTAWVDGTAYFVGLAGDERLRALDPKEDQYLLWHPEQSRYAGKDSPSGEDPTGRGITTVTRAASWLREQYPTELDRVL